MMEGYIAAKVIAEAVRRTGAQPSRLAILAVLDDMRSFDLGGYLVAFKSPVRTGSPFVKISIFSNTSEIRQ